LRFDALAAARPHGQAGDHPVILFHLLKASLIHHDGLAIGGSVHGQHSRGDQRAVGGEALFPHVGQFRDRGLEQAVLLPEHGNLVRQRVALGGELVMLFGGDRAADQDRCRPAPFHGRCVHEPLRQGQRGGEVPEAAERLIRQHGSDERRRHEQGEDHRFRRAICLEEPHH